ncbi:MAG: patatin-like phospholipase family protein [Deferribacteres bacterium]|nr:patatin-like phospholipase family protein [Deferribacteres bacterium]
MAKYIILLIFLSLTQSTSAQEKEVSIGLALSGGGAKGLAHIGVLKVLDEAGVPVHFISGTSMGALVGALYSIGYSPQELQNLAMRLDWRSMLTDAIDRKLLPMAEKDKINHYLGTFELKKGQISLPTGIIKGHNISTSLSEMVWSAQEVNDFSKLPIPFVAVTTDIASGETIPLKTGNLAQALRATMAIPTFLTPQIQQGRLLVDGGITRNLPAEDVRELGANYIIGVDVGTSLRGVDELNSFIEIMDQSIRLGSYLETIEQRNMCNIVIEPLLPDLTFSDFNSAEELIRRGEVAAKKKLPQILAFLNASNVRPGLSSAQRRAMLSTSSVEIDSIVYTGATHRDKITVQNDLGFSAPKEITAKDMTHAMKRIYSSQAYHKITYEIERKGSQNILNIDLQEKETHLFRYGFHFNSHEAAKFLLNTTKRNITGPNSSFSLDLQLANRTQADLEYYTASKNKHYLGFRFRAYYHSIEYDFYNGKNRTAQFGSRINGTDFFIGSLLSKRILAGAGYSYELIDTEREIGDLVLQDSFSRLASAYVLAHYDSKNREAFPTKGVRWIWKTEAAWPEIGSEKKFWRSSVHYQAYRQLSKCLTGILEAQAGITTSDSLPLTLRFYLGGFGSFAGFKVQEMAGNNLQAASIGLQWEIMRDKFITALLNSGTTLDSWKLDSDLGKYVGGFALGIGAATPFGPMQIQFSGSRRHAMLVYISVGYNF